MNKKIVYTDEPMEVGEEVFNLIPPPEQLVRKKVKVTLDLTHDSVNFFKEQGEKLNIPYTKMMRAALDSYAQAHRQAMPD